MKVVVQHIYAAIQAAEINSAPVTVPSDLSACCSQYQRPVIASSESWLHRFDEFERNMHLIAKLEVEVRHILVYDHSLFPKYCTTNRYIEIPCGWGKRVFFKITYFCEGHVLRNHVRCGIHIWLQIYVHLHFHRTDVDFVDRETFA